MNVTGGTEVDMLFIQKKPTDHPEISDIMRTLKIEYTSTEPGKS